MDDIELAKAAFHQSSIQAYIASRMMVATNYLAPIGFYNAHLACECMLKSLLAQSRVRAKPTHDLLHLHDELKKVNNAAVLGKSELMEVLLWLNPYQELGRYGALARAQYEPERVNEPNLKAYGVMVYQAATSIKQIDYAFGQLYKLSEIDNDLLENLQQGKNIPLWKYPITLDEVLFTQNNQFSRGSSSSD